MHTKLIIPILIGALIAARLYLRVRRTFGRQRVRPRRITVRIGILALVGGLLVVFTSREPLTLAALLAGGACGAALGHLGLRHTRFESTPEGRFYTPHTYIGLAVTVLLLARIAYDLLIMSHGVPLAATGNRHAALPPESPTTLAVSGAFIAYYLAYYLGVLRSSRQPAIAAPAIETEPD